MGKNDRRRAVAPKTYRVIPPRKHPRREGYRWDGKRWRKVGSCGRKSKVAKSPCILEAGHGGWHRTANDTRFKQDFELASLYHSGHVAQGSREAKSVRPGALRSQQRRVEESRRNVEEGEGLGRGPQRAISKEVARGPTMASRDSGEAAPDLRRSSADRDLPDLRARSTAAGAGPLPQDGSRPRENLSRLQPDVGLRAGQPGDAGDGHRLPGAKHDEGKLRLDLLPPVALERIGAVLTYGATKYTPNGWRAVPDANRRYTAALLRHLLAAMRGEKIDRESGLSHLAHLATNAVFLLELEPE